MSASFVEVMQTPPPAARGKIVIREAVEADNLALLALTRVTPMAGKISLRIDREPDFFALLSARGTAIVFVAVLAEQIIGCMSATVHSGYIGGVAERVAHVGDLKVHPRFFGTRIALRLITAIDMRLRAEGVDLCLSLMADGNRRAIRFTDGKHGTPAVVPGGRFFVDQLVPIPFRWRSKRYRVEEARKEELPQIARMLDLLHRQRSFAPPVTLEDLCPGQPAASHKTLVVRENETIIATMTVADTQHLRQNVLTGVPTSLRMGLAVLRWLALPMPRFSIPQVGRPIKTLYVRFMACVPGYEAALRPLIAEARVQTFRGRYSFLSVGLHERDPLRTTVAGTLRMTFTSHAMVTSLLQRDRAAVVIAEIPGEDFALV